MSAKYHLKAFSKLTLSNVREKLTEHYHKVGLYENFGQEAIQYLKEKYNHNPYSHEKKDKVVDRKIELLNIWCMNFNGN